MNSLLIFSGFGMSGHHEEVSGVRFAVLENEVEHMTSDILDIKKSTQSTEKAIQSIDRSIAIMTEHVEQNKQLTPRVDALEGRVSRIDLRIAAYAGAATALVFIITKLDKVSAFFG